MKGKIARLTLVVALAVVPMASECSSRSKDTSPTGTMDDPVQGKKEGRRCVTPGQFGETDEKVLLLCSTETGPHRHGDKRVKGETTPHWHRY